MSDRYEQGLGGAVSGAGLIQAEFNNQRPEPTLYVDYYAVEARPK